MNKDQLKKLEADLWSAADKLRANSDLKSSEYATPVLISAQREVSRGAITSAVPVPFESHVG